MLRCRLGKLYTGISTDVTRRIAEHENGQGSKNLRGKGPLQLVFSAPAGTRSEASRLEIKVKRLSRAEKESLLRGELEFSDLL